MRRYLIPFVLSVGVLFGTRARADEFEAGSLVVPMDIDYQDDGMLRAYGLVYELLRNHVPIRWVIQSGKDYGGVDFVVSAVDLQSGDPISDHGYRGGPWVVDASDAADALPIVEGWQTSYPETVVHEATAAFEGEVARYLVVAPTIAMVADGNEGIARRYMQAAAIPDSTLDLAWGDDSPDMLDVDELAGATDTSHSDGLLFDEDGDPVYCQLMSMHWGVGDAEDNPEVVAEVREYLNHPTHFFAECQAVNAFENLDPHGFFLTPNGFEFGDRPDAVDFYHMDSPFGQIDGPFGTVGGSEPSYTLPPGDSYKAGDITMLTAQGTPEGIEDVWMTGFLDGACPPSEHECGSFGKVSYLGGHDYEVDLPMSENEDSQGTRLFLNSLFEAPCATVSGMPTVAVAVDAPARTQVPEVTLQLTYVNTGLVTALDAVLTDPLPAGAQFVAASNGGVFAGGEVSWDLGNLGPAESGDLTIDVQLQDYGTHENSATLSYRVGMNAFDLDSNVSQTIYGDDAGTGTGSGSDSGDGGGGGGTGSSADDGDGDGDSTGGGSDGGTGSGAGESSDDDSGCSCRSTSNGATSWAVALLAMGAACGRRRRSRAVCTLSLSIGLVLGACSGDSSSSADGTGSGEGSGSTGADDGSDGDWTPEKLDLPAEDVFSPDVGCEKIDFLFVIDSSESMKDHQANLVQSFPGFAAAIVDALQADDWHVMIVDTDAQWGGAQCANACTTLGQCPDEPSFPCDVDPPGLCDITIGAGEIGPYGEGASNRDCDLEAGNRYITSEQADLEDAFSCLARVGVDGNSEERTMDALVRASSEPMNEEEGCNAGFLRDDAILVITLITDEPDDASEDGPDEWAAHVIEEKNDDETAIVALGLLPDGDEAVQVCVDDLPAPRMGAFLALFPMSMRASVCEPDYSPFFEDAVAMIADSCEGFVPPG